MRAQGNGNARSKAIPDAGSRHAVAVADGDGWSRLGEVLDLTQGSWAGFLGYPMATALLKDRATTPRPTTSCAAQKVEGAPSLSQTAF